MKNFRVVYRTSYWNPHSQEEIAKNEDYQWDWQAMDSIEAFEKYNEKTQQIENDGKDNNGDGQVDA